MFPNFYKSWRGHDVDALRHIVAAARPGPIVWLVGDSTLDNKAWLSGPIDELFGDSKVSPAVGAYVGLVPQMKRDVAYHVNALGVACINCAVEASTLAERSGKMTEQDELVRDLMQEQDSLVVSVGGNDVVTSPRLIMMMGFLYLLPDCLVGSCLLSPYLAVFRDGVSNYIDRLCSNVKPRRVVACTLYYPCKSGYGWADRALRLSGYDTNPLAIQTGIRKIHELGTRRVTPFALPLYEALDWEDERDYVQRVEPSDIGGAKMARVIVELLKR